MRILPKTVQRLITQSTDAQRVGDALSAAVQPTLNFLNSFFASAQDGSLQVTKPTTFQQVVTAIRSLNTQDLAVNGNVNAFPPSGFFIVPGVNATPFAVTNPANTAYYFIVDKTGVANAISFSSSTGFKTPLFGGTYGNGTASAATLYQHVVYNSNGNQNRLIQMPFAGSVVGISAQYQGSTTQASIGVQVNKNNASLWPLTTITSGATGAYGNLKANKGVYPFAAGDFLTVLSQYGTAGSVALQADLFVEMGA